MSEIDAVRLESEVYPVVKIHAFGEIKNGGTPSSDEANWDGDIPFITPPDLNGLDSKSVASVGRTITELGLKQGSNLVENGVIISGRAPVGYVGVVVTPSAFNQGCKAICTAQNHRYVAYALTASKSNLQVLANGTTFSEISSTALANYAIPLPPLEIQRRIADYLDRETAEIDAAVADLDRYVELLEKRRRAKITFAVEGKSNLVKDNSTESHPVANLGLVAHAYQPETLSMEALNQSGTFPVFGANGIIGRHDNFNHEQPQVVIACRGTCGAVNWTLPKSWINGNAMVINPHAEKLRKDFLFYVLEIADYSLVITGSAQPQIIRESLYRLRVPLPPLETQRRIADYLDRETTEIDSLIADSTRLRDLLLKRRSVLITEVVTGRKQV